MLKVAIYGQEMNGSSWSMARMNLFIHDIHGWNIPSGAISKASSKKPKLPVSIVVMILRTILLTSAKWLISAPVPNVLAHAGKEHLHL